MESIADENSRVIVQGITGSEGRFHTGCMLEFGTNVVAGVTPGKTGQEVLGVPVYDTVFDTVSNQCTTRFLRRLAGTEPIRPSYLFRLVLLLPR